MERMNTQLESEIEDSSVSTPATPTTKGPVGGVTFEQMLSTKPGSWKVEGSDKPTPWKGTLEANWAQFDNIPEVQSVPEPQVQPVYLAPHRKKPKIEWPVAISDIELLHKEIEETLEGEWASQGRLRELMDKSMEMQNRMITLHNEFVTQFERLVAYKPNWNRKRVLEDLTNRHNK